MHAGVLEGIHLHIHFFIRIIKMACARAIFQSLTGWNYIAKVAAHIDC